jgi:hypothetical protein
VISSVFPEAACLGEPYVEASIPLQVESLTDQGLEALARRQRECLAEHTWSREQAMAAIQTLLADDRPVQPPAEFPTISLAGLRDRHRAMTSSEKPGASLPLKGPKTDPLRGRHPRRPTVLVTGCTAKQIGSKKVHLEIVITMGPLVEALKSMGYQVEWRAVKPGEDLSGYERCFVGIMNPYQISAAGGPYLHGAFWTLAQRPDAVIVVDDHATFLVTRSFQQKWIHSPDFVFRFHDWPQEVRDQIMAATHDLGQPWRWETLIAIQGNERCDHSLLGLPLAKPAIAWDPTAFCPHYPVIEAPRERRWVSASLNRTPLPETSWPITVYGNASGMTNTAKLAEAEVVLEYCRAWGALALAHDHPGSGWWRPRYYFCADAGCVIAGPPAEAACLGLAYQEATDLTRVEGMSNGQLLQLAQAQASDLAKVTWSQQRVQDVLSGLLAERMVA